MHQRRFSTDHIGRQPSPGCAGRLNSPETLHTFHFYCGLSPNMAQCCWYKTNFATLSRYALNLILHLLHDPEAEIRQLLQSPSSAVSAANREPCSDGVLGPGTRPM